jgi:hypothetical protein
MNSARTDVEISGFEHPVTRRHIKRLRFGGWTVHVDRAAVTVPSQDIAGKAIEDLAYCLHEAYVLAGVRIASGPPVYGPALADDLTATLHHAQQIAQKQWSARSRDVYRCTRDAWEETCMAVPYALLIRSLRAALPERTTLIDYNDHGDRDQVCGLYARAIALLGGSGERGVA